MTTNTPAQDARTSHLPGFNALLLGATGSGKTTAICKLIDEGLNVFAIFTEPGQESVFKYYSEQGKELPANFHWKYMPPSAPDFMDMIDSATKINTMTFEGLTKMGDVNKRKYREFIDILTTLSNFKSDRDGSEHGSADSWGTDTVLFLDSLSGLNLAAMNLVVGSKPVKSMADWGVAMDNLERLLIKLTGDTRCHFVMTAHLEREADEVTGGTQLMASTLGKKMAPRLPRFFSDVIHCKREGTEWIWSTVTTNVDLKARNLPYSDKIKPDFKIILDAWKRNGGVIEK